MKLYKLDYDYKVIECEIIKETPKTYVYTLPGQIEGNTVRKIHIDKLMSGSLYSQVASSKESLKALLMEKVEDEILTAQKRVDAWKELENKFNKL